MVKCWAHHLAFEQTRRLAIRLASFPSRIMNPGKAGFRDFMARAQKYLLVGCVSASVRSGEIVGIR